MAMIQCPNCNSTINNENAAFCPNCGTRIVRPAAEPVVEPVVEQTPAAPEAPEMQYAEPQTAPNPPQSQPGYPQQYSGYPQQQYQPPVYPQYQQPAYSQQQYAQPYAQQQPGLRANGVGIAGFVLGVIAFVLAIIGWLFFTAVAGTTSYLPDLAAALMALFSMLIVAMLPGVPGFILGLVGICRKGVKKGLAIAGFILNTLTLASFAMLLTIMARYGLTFAELVRYLD